MEDIRYRKYIEEVIEGVQGYTPCKNPLEVEGILYIGRDIDTIKKLESKYGKRISEEYLKSSIYVGEETEYLEKELGVRVNISKEVIERCGEIVKRGYMIEKEAIEALCKALIGV